MTSLAPGLLAAAPPLADPNFDRSVVLLAAHGGEGAFGWVINGREIMSFAELLVHANVGERASQVKGVVRLGGPVSREQIWLLYRTDERFRHLAGQFEVCRGVTASASREVLESIAKNGAPEQLVGIAGYAGWAPHQLEQEIRAGAWLPTDVDAGIIFDAPQSELWERVYERIGATPMAFATRVVGSA